MTPQPTSRPAPASPAQRRSKPASSPKASCRSWGRCSASWSVRPNWSAPATSAKRWRSKPRKARCRGSMSMRSKLTRSRDYLMQSTPELLTALHRHHDTFRAMLQVNLTVLATAHAVSEGIVRGVNGEMQRSRLPNGYTAGGQRATPGPRHVTPPSRQPLSLNFLFPIHRDIRGSWHCHGPFVFRLERRTMQTF